MSKNVKSLTNREQLEKMEKMERKLQEFELQNNAVQVWLIFKGVLITSVDLTNIYGACD